jgi:hypothetical protein
MCVITLSAPRKPREVILREGEKRERRGREEGEKRERRLLYIYIYRERERARNQVLTSTQE